MWARPSRVERQVGNTDLHLGAAEATEEIQQESGDYVTEQNK